MCIHVCTHLLTHVCTYTCPYLHQKNTSTHSHAHLQTYHDTRGHTHAGDLSGTQRKRYSVRSGLEQLLGLGWVQVSMAQVLLQIHAVVSNLPSQEHLFINLMSVSIGPDRATHELIKVMPCLPCHAMPWYLMPCYAAPCRARPCRTLPCHAALCQAARCCAMLCGDLLCRAVRCHSLPVPVGQSE